LAIFALSASAGTLRSLKVNVFCEDSLTSSNSKGSGGGFFEPFSLLGLTMVKRKKNSELLLQTVFVNKMHYAKSKVPF
jgi:hypothetical protein